MSESILLESLCQVGRDSLCSEEGGTRQRAHHAILQHVRKKVG
jgi:hypothetical protein